MKLHWSPRSPFVRKVMVCAHELGLADRIETTRTLVAIQTPNRDLMRDNPLAKIPTLITDDGQILFDSWVICEYLDAMAGGAKLIPAAGNARWQALRWHAYGDNLLDMLILFRNERDRPAGTRSQPHLDAYLVKTLSALDGIEREADALAASPVTIGTLTMAIALGYLDFRFADLDWRNGRASAAAWYATMAARPSIRDTLPIDA